MLLQLGQYHGKYCVAACTVTFEFTQLRSVSLIYHGVSNSNYFDNLSRVIKQQTVGFDGTNITTEVLYDRAGRVRSTSNPYKPTDSVLWTTNDYDVIGRVRKITDAASNISTNSYDIYSAGGFTGQKVISTNAEGQTKTTISDARGMVWQVTDNLGGRIAYEYDAQGNLTKLISKGTSAQPLNIDTVITYDLLGRRTSLSDPDQGTWSYEYNLFGELTAQQDALGQRTEMTYDGLGRMLTRVDKRAGGVLVEGSTAWNYDSATNGLGKVSTVSDSISGYVEAYDYDSLGRLSRTYTSLGVSGADGEFGQIFTYDQIGRPFQEIDATYHGLQYSYNNYGYQTEILEATDTDTRYQKIEYADAWGNITQSKLGNGLKVQRTYEAATGLPDRVLVTNPFAQPIQDNNYVYNDIGILTNRTRYIESNDSTLSETFHYDELNRLTQATATGLPSQTLQYDITGNITSKSGVGTYSYGAGSAGPHAVTGAGAETYSYDATGNMLSGGGRTVTYNTFRKPLTLIKGTNTTAFTYGPDRSHYKRVDSDGLTTKTTISVGPVEFISHSSGVTETKRYIHDIAVVTESSNASTTTHYTHKDSLGSTDIITNSVGGIVAQMSFDAFGQRRNVLSLEDLLEADYVVLKALTTQGFTGHEMVDGVGVIHMNGRIYDPLLGRFMSADPIVSDMKNGQNLNRYSYVYNSPLSFRDPSGFDSTNNCPDNLCDGSLPVINVTGHAGYGGPGVSGSMVFGSGGGTGNTGSIGSGNAENQPLDTPKPVLEPVNNGSTQQEQTAPSTILQTPSTVEGTTPGVIETGRNGPTLIAPTPQQEAASVLLGISSNVDTQIERESSNESSFAARLSQQWELVSGFVYHEGLNVASDVASIIGGIGQIAAGTLLGTTLAGVIPGAALITLGVNNVQVGLTSSPGLVRSFAMDKLGDNAGSISTDVLNIATSIGGMSRLVLKDDARKLFRNIPSDYVRNYTNMSSTGLGVEIYGSTISTYQGIKTLND